MPDQRSFLQAIRQNLDDMDLRLIYADWLEDNSDPLADFVRKQCELATTPISTERWCELDFEVGEIPRQMRKELLGSFADLETLDAKPNEVLEFTFRGGVVGSVQISLDRLHEFGEQILEKFPTLHEVVLFDVNHRGAELAEMPILQHLDSLVICCDEVNREDMESLIASPHLTDLRRLSVWMVNFRTGFNQALTLGLAGIGNLPQIEEVVLVEADEDFATGIQEVADLINNSLHRSLVRIEWEKDRLYSLKGDIEWGGFVAGHLPGNRPGLLIPWSSDNYMAMAEFDEEGHVSIIDRHGPFSDILDVDVSSTDEWDLREAMLRYAKEELRFTPGLIRIKRLELYQEEVYILPHGFDDRDEHACHTCYSMTQSGEYTIDRGGDSGWANNHGTVHST